jgi:antitoxin VapB
MEIAKIFMNGRSQAVRLPKKFRFEGSQVYINMVGDAVILIPYQEPWQTLQDSLSMFSDDFMETRDQSSPQEREDMFT